MGPRRELQRGSQWSPSRLEKKWILLRISMAWAGPPCNPTDAGLIKCINISLTLTDPHRAGSAAGFPSNSYSTMGANLLISESWRDPRRRLSERREQRGDVGPMLTLEALKWNSHG